MHLRLIDLLVCPSCKSQLIFDKELVCNVCGIRYPVINNIPRFVNSDKYVGSFSKEWSIYKQTQLDSVSGLNDAENVFFKRTGFSKEELKNKVILDVGCGIGRFTEIVQKYGGYVVGVDMSYSVNQAYENVGKNLNVDIVQADIMDLPFKAGDFDYVFSIGVIHHTNNTKLAFEKISKLVKPNGKLAVWVYSNDGWKMVVYNAIADFYRLFTTCIPQGLLHFLCNVAVPLYYVHRLPVLGNLTRILLPTSMEKISEWRVLDTFDWYSPKYQTKHTFKEVESWFKKCGFRDIKRLSIQYQREDVSVQGIKID